GVPLFRRLNRQILLTDAGQICLAGLRDGFDRLEAAVAKVRSRSFEGPLTISAAQSFAGKWLVPRLERFRPAPPEIDVRPDAKPNPTGFWRDHIGIAICH